ncbi:MAG: translational GTPase TypA [Bdellovibrionales bacterium]|nr:translational GTPase TypA [Bdellovibrionales bacterium]
MLNRRNVCIIAHVDHGKTTLVDFLLRQAGTFADHQALKDRVMDSMDLERERGITIMAKNTSIRVGDTKINIVDTPGHADFGGEVERILGMVDGAILLVDAAEGPLPQTRFVLQKALRENHKIILVINKVDRSECQGTNRIQEVENLVFDLFIELGATEEQAHFPIVYACGRDGWCTLKPDEVPAIIAGEKKADLKPLFDLILEYIPKPKVDVEGEFKMMISNLSYSDYLGRLAVGRIRSGIIKKGTRAFRLGVNDKGEPIKQAFTVAELFTYEGLKQVPINELDAGEIGIIAGSEDFDIGDTIVTSESSVALERISVEKPTLAMIFSVNTSPFSGREGEAIQSRKLRERLLREVRQNVALRLEETETPDQFRVLGRGELQLGILIEQMRRENFEFMVGKPAVLTKEDSKGHILEPVENVVVDVPEPAVGDVTQLFQKRKGILTKYEPFSIDSEGKASRVRLEFEIPTRGLLGTRSKFLAMTRGEGLISSEWKSDEPFKGEILHRNSGALVADREGETVEYALLNLEDRGIFFFGPGIDVYEGMVVGENNKDTDLNVNVCREKKLTNVRAASAEILVTLSGIRKMSLEDCIEWIDDDEWIEITPKSVRIRKKVLAQNMRSVKRSER